MEASLLLNIDFRFRSVSLYSPMNYSNTQKCEIVLAATQTQYDHIFSQITYSVLFMLSTPTRIHKPKVRKDLFLQSTYTKIFTYTHQTFKMVAPRDLTENIKSNRKSSKENNSTPFFETLWDIPDTLVDLLELSLRYWMPAMNPFTPRSKLSSIIIALFQHSGSDKGGWGEFLPTYWWTSVDLVRWGHEIWSGKYSFYLPWPYEVWTYDDKALHSNVNSCKGIFNNCRVLTTAVTCSSISMLAR